MNNDKWLLKEMVKELATELEEWIEHHYKETKDHGLGRQYNRDLDVVRRARKLIEELEK